jgi:circadian clock protein KaiC
LQLQSIAHGVVSIEAITSDYGTERRRLKVDKLRGVNFMAGYHDSVIVPGGLRVFPRLVASEHVKDYKMVQVKSGLEHLDRLLGGGLERGTSCLFLGPAGCGKSSLMAQFAVAAAERGEKTLVLLFEETKKISLARSKALGLPVKKYIDEGLIDMRQLDPGELAPGQFVNMVISAVERHDIKAVQIDSLNGYLQAMPDVKFLNIQFHELLTYLSHRGIITLMTVAQQGIMGSQMSAPVEITYLADTVVLMRYFEQAGEIKKAVSILKKRVGRHESTIREFQASNKGLQVGETLRDFHGVLTGTPVYKGGSEAMLNKPK